MNIFLQTNCALLYFFRQLGCLDESNLTKRLVTRKQAKLSYHWGILFIRRDAQQTLTEKKIKSKCKGGCVS